MVQEHMALLPTRQRHLRVGLPVVGRVERQTGGREGTGGVGGRAGTRIREEESVMWLWGAMGSPRGATFVKVGRWHRNSQPLCRPVHSGTRRCVSSL